MGTYRAVLSEDSRTGSLVSSHGNIRRFRGAAESLTGVLLTVLLAYGGMALKLDLSIASVLYLLLVVAFAVHCGFWQASVVSVAAIVCEAYFFTPPVFSFYIADPRNGLSIVIFEVTALVVSRVSARERELAMRSRQQEIKLRRLFAVSQGVLLLDLNQSPERQMAELIGQVFELQAVAIVHDGLGVAGASGRWEALSGDLGIVRILELGAEREMPREDGVVETPLVMSKSRIGTLAVLGEVPALALESLASLVVLTLERHAAFVKEGAAEAARQTEQLRSTVLDGLAHAFKTPLTIIRAASSGLLEVGGMDELQTGLTQMIDEQSARLDELATRLLQTARVGDEDLCLQLERVDVGELLHEVVDRFKQESTAWADDSKAVSRIDVRVPDYSLRISADHEMLRSTLTELLDNAVKYSEVGSPVSVSAQGGEGELLLSVHSWGEVIQLEDRERIFERFYRSREQRHSVPGTGIGLSVARRAAEAHRGHIWVTSSEAEGTTFHVSLPRELTHS